MNEKCVICYELINNYENKILKCNHFFHKKCIDEWCKYNRNCPLCRSNIKLNYLLKIQFILL